MTLKGRTSRAILYIAFVALDISLFTQSITFLPPSGAVGIVRGRAVHPAPITVSVANHTSAIVQRVHVESLLDLPVVQQPRDNPNFVSTQDGELTQFAAVSQYGNVGLLAHNYLAGRAFSRLRLGQEVQIFYANGEVASFVVTEILRYQALDPKSPYSSFQNLEHEEEILTAGEMFDHVYNGDHHLTFQTCIEKNGMSSWGRLFIVAQPKPVATSFAGNLPQTFVSFSP